MWSACTSNVAMWNPALWRGQLFRTRCMRRMDLSKRTAWRVGDLMCAGAHHGGTCAVFFHQRRPESSCFEAKHVGCSESNLRRSLICMCRCIMVRTHTHIIYNICVFVCVYGIRMIIYVLICMYRKCFFPMLRQQIPTISAWWPLARWRLPSHLRTVGT